MILAKTEEIRDIEKLNFINLTNRQFAEYEILFRVNDGFSLKSIGDFSFKEQLLFQRFKNKNQQLNLMLMDSVFPIILADMALMVLLGKNCRKMSSADGGVENEAYVLEVRRRLTSKYWVK